MLKKLTPADINQIAAIHTKNAREWSHNAKMGEGHIRKVYEVILGSPESFGFGYFNDDRPASFITATTDYFATMNRLYRLVTFKNFGQLIQQVVSDPNELFDMIEAKFVLPRKIRKWNIKPHLLTWHNNFEEKNCPLAALSVMRKALSELKKRGFDTATAQVDPGNERPNRYYTLIKAPLKYSSRWNNVYVVPTERRGHGN